MKESMLREVVKDYLEKKLPKLIEREINIPIKLNIKRAISIVGPRRVGKTYLMFQLMKKINQPKLYINFEDYRLQGIDGDDFLKLIEIYYQMFPENKKKTTYFFFDEIQNVKNWEKVIRHLLDNERCQIYLTGSSSKLLSKEIATQLRGRAITYNLFPFSFKEFLKTKQIKVSKFTSSYEKAKILNLLENYLRFGGYPEVILFEDKEKILRDLWEVTIARDIIERWQIRNIKSLNLLIKALQNSPQFSAHKFFNYLKSLGLKISKNTIYNYLEYLKECLVVFSVYRFFKTYKDIEKSIPKIYFVDPGLYVENWSLSRAMENIVFIELLKRYENNIYYYITKDQTEIDFYIPKQRLLVEVCFDQDIDHEKKLVKGMKELKLKKATIITWNYEDEKRIDQYQIHYVPLWKWLLNSSA